MKRFVPVVWCASMAFAYLAGYADGPGGLAAAGQAGRGAAAQQGPAGALPPGDYSKIQLSPDQGEPFQFSGKA